jgi:hypothetical protein
MVRALSLLLAGSLLLSACQKKEKEQVQTGKEEEPLFSLLTPEQTQITFTNTLTEGLNTNILMYEYFYNGGGVAAGDLNGDGLDDLYFTANMTPNRLYLNRGNMRFEDITDASGAAGRPGPWKTGVTMADVNGDRLLDIYVCYSGSVAAENRTNQLFINQGADAKGIPHFKEESEAYGLNHPATSTHAVFFDSDRDGDLDLFLLNHNPKSLPVLDEASTAAILKQEDASAGCRFFRNDKGKFKDITRQSGIQSVALSYGLGVNVADVNGDGWPDIYVGNDYTVPDFLYLNNRNGTFTNQIQQQLRHTSHFSMGNDIADINNDGYPDIYTLDMLPEDNRRQKLLMAPDNYEKFDLNLRSGFYYQYMRNMLHVNNGNGTFSEVGQLAGISNTDWSWAPLFADLDNDGWKDLFVTNGYPRDYTNQDFLKYMGDFMKNRQGNIHREDVLSLVQQIPASNLPNYVFRNNGDLTFTPKSWGLRQPVNSSGAVFSDLDNDGDLDLIVNNTNQPAAVYRNDAKAHYLAVRLEGEQQNSQGIGAKVRLRAKGQTQYLEQSPSRGYQSSVTPVLHFGLGTQALVDTLEITWPDGKTEVRYQVKADQTLVLKESAAKAAKSVFAPAATAWYEAVASPVNYVPATSTLNDFKRQPLMVNPQSFTGPALAKADVNGDGREDVYVGGGNGKGGALFVQQAGGAFSKKTDFAPGADETAVLFFDANKDGFPDLYVAAGGYGDLQPDDVRLQDKLYFNDGKGNFQPAALPSVKGAKGCVKAADINGDGAPDLFVGGKTVPGRYPESSPSYLLINDGKGHFTDLTDKLAPGLRQIGMVSDAAWLDLNRDKTPELLLVGEWMPLTVLGNQGGKWVDKTADYFPKSYKGWWNRLLVDDLNGDGRPDLIVGNQGTNTQCRVSEKEPAELYVKDFDDNGAIDPILCFYIQGKSYPYVTRDELLDQLSIMRTRFPDYKSYAEATLTDIFTEEERKDARKLEANCLHTMYFRQGADGKFSEQKLPLEAQMAPVMAMTVFDVDRDGRKDLLLAGNINRARLRFGNYDANYGVVLRGDGKGGFSYVPQHRSGFRVIGDVRNILTLNETLLLGINEKPLVAYRPAKK